MSAMTEDATQELALRQLKVPLQRLGREVRRAIQVAEESGIEFPELTDMLQLVEDVIEKCS